jgi:hypothetical protein
MGTYVQIDSLIQLKSTPERRPDFEKLAGPESILIGKLVEFETLLQPESQAVEFRELTIRIARS